MNAGWDKLESQPAAAPAAPVAGAVTAPTAATAPVQQPVAAPAAPVAQPAAPTAEAKPEWVNNLAQQIGVNPDQWKPEDLMGTIKQTIQRAQQLEKEVAALRQQPAPQVQQPQFQQPAAPPAAPAPKKWFESAPEYDPTWESKIFKEVDDKGQTVLSVAPGEDPKIIEKLRAYNAHRADVVNRFTRDPQGTLDEIYGDRIDKKVRELTEGTLQQRDMQATARGIVDRNKAWMYDANPLTGQQALSEAGKTYMTYIQQSDSLGMPPDVQDAWCRKMAYADMKLAEEQKRTAPAAAPAPAPAVPAAPPQVAPQPQGLGAQYSQGWAPTSLAQPAAPPPPSNGFTQLAAPQAGIVAGVPVGSVKQGLEQAFLAAGIG